MKTKKKILIVDPIHESALKLLEEKYDLQIHMQPENDVFMELIRSADALILRSGVKLTRRIIENGICLQLIARAGNGFDNIDLQAASDMSIPVFNTPNTSAITVAEHTFALLFALSRQLVIADCQLRQNLWNKSELYGRELNQKTMGIVGLGAIGMHVARIAKGIGMKVIACASRVDCERREAMAQIDIELMTIERLLERSDIVSLHCPLNDSTNNLISVKAFTTMKKCAYLINMARGGVVNESDLYTALANGNIAGAGIDVFEHEKKYSKLFELPNVVVTPHIGAMSEEAQVQIAKFIVSNIEKGFSGQPINNRLV
ncbi:MAG: hydroxyacid dehydrogenase [Hyphomicrobiales bacterium]|nr:hydroxyacid dehydrogenase [Hyphomicrobiales bacterium]